MLQKVSYQCAAGIMKREGKTYHIFLFQNHPTGALPWLMEDFHMLLHFPLLESSAAFVAVHMICCFFFPENNSAAIMRAGNIVSHAVCLVKMSRLAGYMSLTVPTQY